MGLLGLAPGEKMRYVNLFGLAPGEKSYVLVTEAVKVSLEST